MSNKMISALMVSLVLLVWALALPVAEADRKVSQQTDVTQVSVQLFSELDEISWPVLAYQHATSSLPSEPVGGGLRPWKLVEGDFNEDGRVDLVTIYRGANVAQLRLRFGDGRGGFTAPHRFDLPAQQPVAVALGDVDLDGHLDVVLAHRDATAISVLEGTGDGAFQSTKMYEVGSTLQSLALADVDRDGYEDALVACETPGCLALLRGDGRGFEQPLPLYTWPDEETPDVKAMRAADVDGDGLTDVILALEREVVLLSAARAYEPVNVVSSESEFTAMTLGDFNADESMDVVVAQAGGDMMVLLGDRQGGFLPPRILRTGWRITAMTAAHLNEDGYLDLAVVRADRAEVTVLLGDAHGGFKAYSRLRVESRPVTIMASRLNKDALADLVIAQREGDAIALAMSTAAAIVVNTTRDAMDVPATASVDDLPGSDGLVSLREAIVAANNTPGPQDIVFHIPRSDPGFDGRVFRLELTSALPQLSGGGTVIDGSTQTPFTGDTNPAGPEVVLDGSSLGVSVDGFTVTSSFNVIRGFVIGNFSGSGVKIVGRATGNIVAGNFIGTDETGAEPRPNQFFGVLITGNGSQANIVGGTAPEDRNVISGNENSGVALNFPTFDNRIVGNYIGVDASGTQPLPNGGDGVFMSSVRNNIIGGITPGAANVISGNLRNGVSIEAGTNNQIVGNLIGTDVTGAVALPNSGSGVMISNGSDATIIGGVGPRAGNVISGNMGSGIKITNSVSTNILGNLIGTDVTGTMALGNAGHGVMIKAAENRIGGPVPQARNLISGNARAGVYLDAGSAFNDLLGNYIGVDITGANVLPNGGDGVSLFQATNNTVGGPIPGSRNVIACNGDDGVGLLQANDNLIENNFIGTDASASACLGNFKDGVRIEDAVGNRVVHNTITCNSRAAISILGASLNNRVSENAIFDNGALGIDLNGDGVTFNDPSDLDTGPNDLRNFPIITSIEETDGGLLVSGVLPTLMPQLQTIEIYRAMPDPSGYGEGGQFLVQAKPDAEGRFSVLMPASGGANQLVRPLTNGDQLTATAIDIAGNTSEFSPNFTIGIGDAMAPLVTVLAPNGGELIDAGETMTVEWRSSDNVGVVAQDVLFSTDGGRTFKALRTNLAGSIQKLQVQVPIVLDTTQARVCVVVRDGAGNESRDCSDDDFVVFGRDVVPPTVKLESPNGGEIIAAGRPFTIRWTATDNKPDVSCDVMLSTDGGATYTTLVSGLTGTDTYEWQVPETLGSNRARIRVVCRDGAGLVSQDESDALFAIDRDPPAVTVTAPNQRELIVRIGAPVQITWTASDDIAIATFDIFLSLDGGQTYEPIATDVPGTERSYAWQVPRGMRSPRARIRIVAHDFVGRTTTDESDSNFILIRIP